MAVDFTKPTTGDNYSTQFVPNLLGNFVGLAQLLDSSITTITGTIASGVKRYNATSSGLEEYNGSTWVAKQLQGWQVASGNIGAGVAPSIGTKVEVPGSLAISSASGAQYLLFGNRDSGGTNKPVVFASANGQLTIGTGTSWASASGGTSTGNIVVASTGEVGINTVPAARLHVDSAGTDEVARFNATANPYVSLHRNNVRQFYIQGTPTDIQIVSEMSAPMRFLTNATERFRIHDDAGLGVMTLAGSVSIAPASGGANLFVRAVAGQAAALNLTANGITPGGGLSLFQDAPGVGYLYNRQNAALILGTNNTARLVLSSTGAFSPNTDAGQNFGGVGNRWATVFAQELSFGTNSTVVSFSSGTLLHGSGSGWTAHQFYTGGTLRMGIDSTSMVPGANNTYSFGLTANRWSNVFSVLGNYSGALTALSFDSAAASDVIFRPAGTARLALTVDGRLYGTALHNNAGAVTGTTNQYIASGTFTPTLTNGANVSASNAAVGTHRFVRVGNVAIVAGSVLVTPTASATDTVIDLSLPIASDLQGGDGDLAGTAVSVTNATNAAKPSGYVFGNTTANTARIVWQSNGTAAQLLYYRYMYEIR